MERTPRKAKGKYADDANVTPTAYAIDQSVCESSDDEYVDHGGGSATKSIAKREKFPVTIERQLLEDIENFAGLHNEKGGDGHAIDKIGRYALSTLLDDADRVEFYGVKGSSQRKKIGKRVDMMKNNWSKLAYLRRLQELGITPHNFRCAAAGKSPPISSPNEAHLSFEEGNDNKEFFDREPTPIQVKKERKSNREQTPQQSKQNQRRLFGSPEVFSPSCNISNDSMAKGEFHNLNFIFNFMSRLPLTITTHDLLSFK